jgi:hypothetical protein
MSWIFGVIKPEQSGHFPSEYGHVHSQTLLKLSLPTLYIALGGIKETCLFEVQKESPDIGWAVVGLGVRVTESGGQFLGKNDWKTLLSSVHIPVDSLDGHFIIVRWKKNEIEFFTDQLGFRTVYYDKCLDGICFSTRLDWVSQMTGQHEINQASLGGRWLLFNQLTYESCLNGIERLGPSAHVIIKNDSVKKHESHPWLPEFDHGNDDDAKAILNTLVRIATESNCKISLSLSGGMDSRVILALFMAAPNAKFGIHTFGELMDPDVQISQSIAQEFGLQRQYFNEPIPDTDTLVSLVQLYAAQNILTEPASSIMKMRYILSPYLKGCLIVDGGFGEIARRQHLNRIVWLGRSALRNGNFQKLLQLMHTPRADIFSLEFTKKMESATLHSLEITLSDMPPVSEIGMENFVDLFSVRTRIPNFGGTEQSRSDALVMNFMPLVQPSFLKAMFRTDLKSRRNGRLYREIIHSKEPRLSKFPLAKAGTTHPFHLSLPMAKVVTKIKSKVGNHHTDSTADQFLMQLKEYVLDIVHSHDVKDWDGYDYKKVLTGVSAYYKGEYHLRTFVDWWLMFELWRRSLLIRK